MTGREQRDENMHDSRRVKFVSFSGVDGAGKTTQIESLCAFLTEQGVRYRVYRFWDDIARLTHLREGTGHRVFRGDKGIGSPEAPISRRDKNVRGWPMTCVRLFLYTLDAFSQRSVFNHAKNGDAEFVIFDRYIYDELANLDLANSMIRAYVRFIMRLVPRPDVSFLLDADPEAARARKPEYPVDFIRQNRQAYFDLDRLIGGLTIVAPMEIEEAKMQVVSCAASLLDSGDAIEKKQKIRFTKQTKKNAAL